jgi:AcrR family transcriptional regulator
MGVYNRFGSKDGLIESLLIRGFTGLRDAVQTPGIQNPIERLYCSGRQYRAFALSHRQHYAIMFEGVIPVAEFSPELHEVAAASFNALVGHVEYAMAAGAIAAGDPREAAQMIWSAVHGAVALELQDNCQVPDPAENYERLLGLIVRGLQAGPASNQPEPE